MHRACRRALCTSNAREQSRCGAFVNAYNHGFFMNLHKWVCFYMLSIALSLCLLSCTSPPVSQQSGLIDPKPGYLSEKKGFTPHHAYAGEVLSYMMRVVVGLEGAPEKQTQWRTRGLDAPLDFNQISKLMYGPVHKRSKIMVLDTNILGLSEILYHYNEGFNLFKGTHTHPSLYPSAELVALRMLMIRKMNNKKAINFKEMVAQKAIFFNRDLPVKKYRLRRMEIDMEEFNLLRDVFGSDPMFGRYLDHPFLIAAFLDAGIVKTNSFTRKLAKKSAYKKMPCDIITSSDQKKRFTIAILPSMTKMFEAPGPDDSGFLCGFKPTAEYEAIINKLTSMLTDQAMALKASQNDGVLNRIPGNRESADAENPSSETPLAGIRIQHFNKRPLVVFPGNVRQVISAVCPEADLVIVIMGKNVYRSIHMDPDQDVVPKADVFFLDIMDVKYGLITDEIQIMAQKILSLSAIH